MYKVKWVLFEWDRKNRNVAAFHQEWSLSLWIENSEWNVLQYRINQSDARIIAVKAGGSKYRFQYVYTMHGCMCAFLKGNTRFEVSDRCLSVKKNLSVIQVRDACQTYASYASFALKKPACTSTFVKVKFSHCFRYFFRNVLYPKIF